MRFGILGPVQIRHGGSSHRLPRAQTRGLLAYLLLNANRVVSLDSVVDALWGGAEPATARSQVHSSIHAIRRQLRETGGAAGDGDPLAGRSGGYMLTVAVDQLDSALFGHLTGRARTIREAGGDLAEARALLREALELWRGPALADATGAFVEAARARLADQRLTTTEDLIETELALGRHTEVIGEFAPLADEHPLRERLRGQLMLALYRSGRQVDALQSYQEYRSRLADEQGLDPGQPLRELERAILRADPALDLPRAAAPTVRVPLPPAAEPEPGPAESGAAPIPRPAPAGAENLPVPRSGMAVPVIAAPPAGPAARSRPRSRRAPLGAAAVVLALALAAWLVGRQVDAERSAEDPFESSGATTVSIVNEGPPGTEGVQRVLEVADFQVLDGARIHAWSLRAEARENARHQIWIAEEGQPTEEGVTTRRLRNVNSDKCLDRGYRRTEADVVQAECNQAASQQWYFDAEGRMRNSADGDCLEIAGARWADGAPVRMAPCGTGWNQQWFQSVRRDWS
jgi:DNA-binding SARP family transcriptional activator